MYRPCPCSYLRPQAVGWTLFGFSVVYIAALVKALLQGVVRLPRYWAAGGGVLMLGTPCVLALSLLTYEGRSLLPAIIHSRRHVSSCVMLALPVSLDGVCWADSGLGLR